jgi:hypothetical protein
MKKIILAAIVALATSSAMAGSLTVEGQSIEGLNGLQNGTNYGLNYKENINKNFAGDIGLNQTQGNTTKAITNLLEAGLTASTSVGPVGVYVRSSLGERYTNTTNYSYYGVEPGVTAPLGNSGLTARLGYRYRNAFSEGKNFETGTIRAGLGYTINKNNAIGVRYDRMRGDSDLNIFAVNFTRSF